MQQKLQNEKIKTEEERKNNEDIKVLCQSGQIQAVFNKYEKQIRQLFIYYIESCERQLDKYSTDIFNRKGEMRHIRRFKFWKLQDVLQEKYAMEKDASEELASFLLPCLEISTARRVTAAKCLENAWLRGHT